jgi:hypothetical protein
MTTGNPSSAFLWSGRILIALVTLVMIADAAKTRLLPERRASAFVRQR